MADTEMGIAILLEFLSKIYKKYSIADAQDKYVAFETFKKKNEEVMNITRLSYYNVTTRLVDLVGLCWLKQN